MSDEWGARLGGVFRGSEKCIFHMFKISNFWDGKHTKWILCKNSWYLWALKKCFFSTPSKSDFLSIAHTVKVTWFFFGDAENSQVAGQGVKKNIFRFVGYRTWGCIGDVPSVEKRITCPHGDLWATIKVKMDFFLFARHLLGKSPPRGPFHGLGAERRGEAARVP